MHWNTVANGTMSSAERILSRKLKHKCMCLDTIIIHQWSFRIPSTLHSHYFRIFSVRLTTLPKEKCTEKLVPKFYFEISTPTAHTTEISGVQVPTDKGTILISVWEWQGGKSSDSWVMQWRNV